MSRFHDLARFSIRLWRPTPRPSERWIKRSGSCAQLPWAVFPLLLFAALTSGAVVPSLAEEIPPDRKQTRPVKARVEVSPDKVLVDDGDTVEIIWGPDDEETVRILGIDTPEIQHVEHNLPFDQPFGREAAGFAAGAFACAQKIELLRAEMKDPYGRTLGYLFLNGQNYSEMVLKAGLAVESVSHYGDNGFPDEAARVIEAARQSRPAPFEPPHEYRQRMRAVSEWMKAHAR